MKRIIGMALSIFMAFAQTENEITLHSYENHSDAYAQGTPDQVSGEFKEWLDRALSLIEKDHAILELGSGAGRDADYIKSCGYRIECSDAAPSFVQLLQNRNHEAFILNILTDALPKEFKLIFANAVFLHFNRDEFAQILNKIYASLPENGFLVFSVKQGAGENWSDDKLNAPRYYCYWQKDELEKLLTAKNFEIIEIAQDDKHKWFFVIAQKYLAKEAGDLI